MALWVLADAHGGADPGADRDLLRLLAQAERERADLLILGDLFAAWIALERSLTRFQAEVLDRLRELRRRGSTVRFVVGNRDYLVKEGQLGRSFDEVLEGETLIPLGGIPTLVLHGHGLDPSDRLYHLWHRLSRSSTAGRALDRLPGPLARPLAERVERALRQTNQSYKTGALPIQALAALARRAKARGAARALLGHFHAEQVIETEGGVPLIIAPDWLEHRRILRLEPDGRLFGLAPLSYIDPARVG